MKKFFVLNAVFIALLAGCFSACNKNKEDKNDAYKGAFEGTLTNYGSTALINGSVAIENGKATIELLAGRLEGTAQKDGDSYRISIMETFGVFQAINNISGTINPSSEMLLIEGVNLDGSPAKIEGKVKVETTGGWENLTKAAVTFTHNQPGKLASVTIDGVTFSGLNAHYEGGKCNPQYNGGWNMLFNFEDGHGDESGISCYTGTQKKLNGTLDTFTDCSSIRYILNKNTEYTYTVTWNTGETYTKTFTTLGGGATLPICLSSDGSGGGGVEPGKGQLTYDGKTLETFCNSYSSDSCQGYTDVMSSNTIDDVNYRFNIYNIPSQQVNGVFPLEAIASPWSCQTLYATFLVDDFENGTKHFKIVSGSFTKTSAKSFTFHCLVSNEADPSETYTVTGAGAY